MHTLTGNDAATLAPSVRQQLPPDAPSSESGRVSGLPAGPGAQKARQAFSYRSRAMIARASSSDMGGPSTGVPVWPATSFMAW